MTTNSLSAVPAWVNSLADSTIRADMVTATGDGTITYSELLTVLKDLSANLSLGTSGLTTGQFSDLKAIASNWKNGVTMSSYLDDVLSRMVNGDLANATFTGGGTATVLGNLAVGSSVTQINTLIGKWFLGTDLPSSTVTVGSTFKITYAASTAPLFSTGGPSVSDINQGAMNDCYLLSSLAEVALNHPSLISSMFVDNGNNTYGVRFYVNGKEDWVTVNNYIPMIGTKYAFNDEFNSVGNNWVDLAEKAFAQLNAQGIYTGNGHSNYGNSFSTIGNGGSPVSVLRALTNSTIGYYTAANNALTLNAIVSALSIKNDVVLTSWTNSYDSAGYQCLVAGHAMSITGYNSATGNLIVRNPWGTKVNQTYRTSFEVSLAALDGTGDSFAIDSLSSLTPKLVTQTGTQTWQEGQAVSFALPVNTFTDPSGLAMTYSATQANGQALPSWLTFNAATGTFSGVVPTGTAAFNAIVTATDSMGLTASETIQIAVIKPPASPPILSTQTANQTWAQGVTVAFSLPANTFTDPQGTAMTVTATLADGSALPSWLTFNSATNSFSGTVAAGTAGLSIKVTAKDAAGLSVSETFSVSTPALAPKLVAQTGTQTWQEGQVVSFTLPVNTFTDPSGLTMTYSATQANGLALPSWLTVNAATGTFSGVVPTGTAGFSALVTATDSLGLSASETIQIAVLKPLVISNQTASQTWYQGLKVALSLPANTFTDPQGTAMTISATLADGSALPSWLTFNSATNSFSGTVAAGTAGLSIKVTAKDAAGLSVSETFSVSTPVAAAPKLTVQTAMYTITEGVAANFTLVANTFTDPQNSALTYTATQSNGQALPSWLTFNAATRKFTALPPANANDVTVKVTATDTLGLSASESFTIYTPPAGPYLAYQTANKVVVTGTSVSIKVPAGTFLDDKVMTYSAYQMKYDGDVDATSWLHFDSTTSTFSGVVAANENGTLHMKVVALDTLGRSANETFDISFKNSSGLTLASTSVPTAGQSTQTYALLSIAH